MIKQVFKIDEDGYYVEPVIILEGEELPSDCIEERPPDGLYKAQWTGEEWIEAMSDEEIADIQNQPVEPTKEEKLKEELEITRMRLDMTEATLDSLLTVILPSLTGGGIEGGEK